MSKDKIQQTQLKTAFAVLALGLSILQKRTSVSIQWLDWGERVVREEQGSRTMGKTFSWSIWMFGLDTRLTKDYKLCSGLCFSWDRRNLEKMKFSVKSWDHHGVSSEGVGPSWSLPDGCGVQSTPHHTLPAPPGCLPQAHSGRTEISRADLPSFQLSLGYLPHHSNLTDTVNIRLCFRKG